MAVTVLHVGPGDEGYTRVVLLDSIEGALVEGALATPLDGGEAYNAATNRMEHQPDIETVTLILNGQTDFQLAGDLKSVSINGEVVWSATAPAQVVESDS